MKPVIRPSRPGRTFELKLLCAGFLLFSIPGWLRMQQALVNSTLWPSLFESPSPLYLAVTGGVWGLAGLIVAVGLWLRLLKAPKAARASACIAGLGYWLERWLFSRSADAWVDWPFWTLFTLLLVGLVFLILAHPRQKRQFL